MTEHSQLPAVPIDPLADAWEAAWTGVRPFALCCTPDVHYEDPIASEPLDGLAALERHAERLRAGFPDLRVERTAERLATPTHACIPWRLAGTHRGDTGPLTATGRFVIVHGLHYVELDGELIRRARGFFDLYETGVQLGTLPARGGFGEAALLMLRGFGLRARG